MLDVRDLHVYYGEIHALKGAEGARTPLHALHEPSDDVVVMYQAGGGLDDLLPALEFRITYAVLLEQPLDLVGRELRSRVRVGERRRAPLAEERVVRVGRGAHARAAVARVAEAGNQRLGKLEPITAPAGFPLRLMRAPNTVAPRLALIGDAAHTIHPLSGHGINLGFQDARALATVLCDKPAHVDCGDLLLLRGYERARKEEVVTLQAVTDSLHGLFRPATGSLTHLRNFGLNLTNTLPVVKDLMVRYALTS